jgi:hypothetical protein|tara:strand:- start:623 stop:1276 length:654 start_codon:yes stop_codon:yes gene_type:complete
MAQISSYPLLTPQFGDKVLGSNVVDSSGTAVTGNPTCQYNFTEIKSLVDQNYVQQVESSSGVASQASAQNVPYSIQFGIEAGTTADNVRLLKTNAGDVGANKVQFNKAGTYQITLTYSVGVNQGANTPYLIFRTLKDGTSQIGPTVVVNQAFPTINTPISLIIPITIQVTTSCYYNFQMMRSNAGANDGGLVKNGTPLNVTGVTEPSIATIKISKLI